VVLHAGDCLAVTGPSGAGKSLFLRMLADLDDHAGEAWLDGAPCSGFAAPDWRRRVAYLAAEPGWWLDRVGAHFAPAPGALLAELGLTADILDRPVALCSTGERQRLALLRTLARDPPVLLLDEPTGALDVDSVAAVERILLRRLQAGTAIVLVTHNPAQAARLGTQHVRIERGRMALT
jgi:putative ABC transport system ATP-binding protein